MSIQPVLSFLATLADLLIPRFIYEDVVLEQLDSGTYATVMPLANIEPGEVFDAVCPVCVFTWFGVAWFGWAVGEPRPFTEGPSA